MCYTNVLRGTAIAVLLTGPAVALADVAVQCFPTSYNGDPLCKRSSAFGGPFTADVVSQVGADAKYSTKTDDAAANANLEDQISQLRLTIQRLTERVVALEHKPGPIK
jgi:hypothetical protein